MEVASTAIIGGLTLKALYALSKASTNYFIQPRVREIINKAYQKVTRKNKKLLKRKLDEDDLEFLQQQIDDIYTILDVLWEETKDPEIGKKFLEELSKTLEGLKIQYDQQLSKVLILEDKTKKLDEMVYYRFEVIYDALEDIFLIMESYNKRINSIEKKLEKIEKRIEELEGSNKYSPRVERPLIPGITLEMMSDPYNKDIIEEFVKENKEYSTLSSKVGVFRGTEDSFSIAVSLGKEVLEAYLVGSITFNEALETLEMFEENLRRGYAKTREIVKVRELFYLLDAIKKQIIILSDLKRKQPRLPEKKKNPIFVSGKRKRNKVNS